MTCDALLIAGGHCGLLLWDVGREMGEFQCVSQMPDAPALSDREACSVDS